MNENLDEINQRLKELREKAEARFVSADPKTKSGSIAVPVDLLHELRIHQIELEMQNEELTQAQVALEQSRAHFRELYDFAPVGYLTLNDEGIILEINLTAAKLLNEDRSKIVNRRFVMFIRDDFKDLWYRHFLMAKQADGKYGCELPFIFNNGDTFYYHLECLYIVVNDVSSLLRVTLTDITGRKQAEVALRIAAAAFETQIGMVVASASKTILSVNQAFTRITGYSAEEAMRLTCFNAKCYQDGTYKAIWAIVMVDGYWEGEIWDKRKNGESFPIWITISAVLDNEGHTTHYVISFTDITDRKRTNEELRIAAAAFEAQEGIIITDNQQVIIRVNNAFTRITGYSAEYAVGKTPAFLHSGIHGEEFYENLWVTVASDRYWQGEIWNKRSNGEIFPVWETITAVTDKTGQITHFVGSFIDISVQKQAEKILLEARERLENQVASTEEEMAHILEETEAVNTALKVLLKQRESDKADAQATFAQEVEATVLPLLKKLKAASAGRHQTMRLIKILETTFQELAKSYGRAANLGAAYQKLTPVETQVASMIRQGLPTKVIAAALNIAPGTVSIHRKHIRKKFGLDSKSDNLYSYLQSLTE